MNVLLSFILALLPNLPIQQLDRTLNSTKLGVSTAVPTIEQVSGSEQLCSNVVDIATTIKEAEAGEIGTRETCTRISESLCI